MSSRRPRPARKPVSRTPVWVLPAAVVGGLALLVATFLIVRWYVTPLPPAAPSLNTTDQVITTITHLDASEFETVGKGSANNLVKPISGTALVGSTGKPEVFYYGGEFCPYCAAERWPIIVALSRFGTWSGLATTSSSSSDVNPNTPTFTFRNATFSSQYIDFRSVEATDRDRKPLQAPTAAEQDLINHYDTGATIPFVDFGNRYALSGATYSPDVLSGMSWLAISNALTQPGSSQAQAILGSANLITAAVCKLSGDQPSEVCSGATIQDLEKTLK